jgi:hypothetical protein
MGKGRLPAPERPPRFEQPQPAEFRQAEDEQRVEERKASFVLGVQRQHLLYERDDRLR